ncbi:GNAT family N-acetyltransferase [Ligilactobacillus salivarius]|uniref:GNAT family N-acetyltransferase n=1 Tax=Ligilactobacillus salivarius TaxID=1624 RepID=UPI0011C9ED28|nr:GNAT family N-acetyltransferase [Ligilactobacillus salivarius]TXJ76977.1 GNAT family N-acetyltransferase [Ligilactobacillus salivarius]
MEKINIKNRNLSLIDVWEKSVRETHLFLSNKEIDEIKNFVPMALKLVPHLIIESDANGVPIAFMGIDDRKLEMLFIDPRERGKGLGRKLLEHGITNYGVKEVVVNEQNPQAKGFYEHMEFKVYERSEIDEQGKPYPILFMKL